MIYLFSGDDAKGKRTAYEKFLKSAPKDAEVFNFRPSSADQEQIRSFYSGSGLFFKKSIVVFSDVLAYQEHRDFFLGVLPMLRDSGNIFVFLEGKLTKPILDEFKESRAEMSIFEALKAKKDSFDNFLLANSFGAKDKLNLWIYFRQALQSGTELEPLAGILLWKAKDMLTKRNFSKFSEGELKNFVQKISYLLPEARLGNRDAEVAFEKFLLEAF